LINFAKINILSPELGEFQYFELSSENYSSFIILIALSSRHDRKKRFMGFC
jgi:hypothetical protein